MCYRQWTGPGSQRRRCARTTLCRLSSTCHVFRLNINSAVAHTSNNEFDFCLVVSRRGDTATGGATLVRPLLMSAFHSHLFSVALFPDSHFACSAVVDITQHFCALRTETRHEAQERNHEQGTGQVLSQVLCSVCRVVPPRRVEMCIDASPRLLTCRTKRNPNRALILMLLPRQKFAHDCRGGVMHRTQPTNRNSKPTATIFFVRIVMCNSQKHRTNTPEQQKYTSKHSMVLRPEFGPRHSHES